MTGVQGGQTASTMATTSKMATKQNQESLLYKYILSASAAVVAETGLYSLLFGRNQFVEI